MRRNATFITNNSSATGILVLFFVLFITGQAAAQTPVFRTSSVYAGTSPFQDSLWTFKTTDYSVVKRLGPTTPGHTITGITGLAMDPMTGTNYAILKESGVSGRVLSSINVQTGVCSDIGNLGTNFATLAFNANGTLFGVTGNGATPPETMFRIDKATGIKTLFRPLGAGADGEIIAFCPDNNKFYHWSGNGTVVWERMDTTGLDVIQGLSYSGYGGGEIFGALYIGGGKFLVSNIASHFFLWDTSGTVGPFLSNNPDDIRGLVMDVRTTSITPGGSPNLCIGSSVTLTVSSGTSNYQWYHDGTAISGETNSTYVASTAGVYNCIYTDPNGISDSVATGIVVTVNAIPDVAPTIDQTLCNGASTTAVTFNGSVSGTVFNWTNDNTAIGLAASGSGNIPSFSATNISNVPITGMIIVTPVNGGCAGTPDTFIITVNPTPDVVASPNQTLCNDSMTSPINFTGSVAGTIYTWINTNSAIGLSTTGTGDIAAFTATNSTPDPISGVVTVMTTANGCSGSSNSFTITVEPTPMLSSPLSAVVCNNILFHYGPATLTSGTTFYWSRDSVTGISNSANSDVDSVDETLINTTPNPIAVTYVYTLTANGCPHTQNVVVTVNPTPVLTSSLTPPAICDSTMFVYGSSSATSGTTYSWSRAVVTGISNPAASGVDTIREVLWNNTTEPVMVTYVDTLMANGCMNTQSITVTVNPRPMLTTPTSLPGQCDSMLFFYVPASATTGTTFAWSRGAITGISNAAAHGADTISEILINTSPNPITVTYIDTLTANGCINTQPVTVVVYPKPMLSSALTPPGICDSAIFNYTPMSLTLGTGFTWVRPFVLGINAAADSGSNNPNEQLINTTNDNLDVTYHYTLTANGCTNKQNVVVVVHPTPVLSSALTPSTCSGEVFNYTPTSYTFGTTFAWTRGAVTGITPATGAGSGNVSETLVDSGLTARNTIYHFTLTANGCSHTENITVTVKPAPPVVSITTHPDGTSLCLNTMFQNFGASMVPPAGQNYQWTAVNATVWATGSDKQYSLVSFDKQPGTAVIILKSNVTGVSCITNSSISYEVGTDMSDDPAQIIYFNGQLVCLRNDMDSYQWGFDDATTLDSTMVAGEHNPNYFINSLDLTYRYYWVITTHNGCMQKSYYNLPTGITSVNNGKVSNLKVYPNPAENIINVELNTVADGNYEVEVINILGQKVGRSKLDDHKAKIDVANLPAGCYLVDCYRDGIRVGTSRFIKN